MGATAAEEVGHATLQIVHDLKNQLNGLKLYATFLRKRLEQKDKSSEEQEIVAKLIAGLDNAAREMTSAGSVRADPWNCGNDRRRGPAENHHERG